MPKTATPQKYKSQGTWIGYRIQWLEPNGKRGSKTIPFSKFGGDKKAAYEAAVAELKRIGGEMQAIADGQKQYENDSMTLQEFFDDYWEPDRNAMKRHPQDDRNTWDKYYKKNLGPKPINKIGPEEIRNFKKKVFSTQKPATQKNVLSLLRAMLYYAAELGKINAVPIIKPPRVEPYDYKVIGDEKKAKDFLAAAKKLRDDAYTLYATAIYAGLRSGELAGLHWEDVDFQSRRIKVRFSYKNSPKSGKSRFVPILDELCPILHEWKEKSAHLINPLGLVFPPSSKKEMWRADSRIFREVYHAALKNAGLPRMKFHELRHTFATMWVNFHGDPWELKEALGHSDFSVVEKYTHKDPDTYKGATGMFLLTKKRKSKQQKSK